MAGLPDSGRADTPRTPPRPSDARPSPEADPDLPPRSRGVIALLEENCTVCMLCARECPDWCISIDSHKETVPAPEGGRPRTRNVLDRFEIDFSLCMYCGICVEVCPFDALFWSPEYAYAEYDIRDLVHGRDRLREWMWTVPPPPAADPAAETPREVVAAGQAARQARRAHRTSPASVRDIPPPGAKRDSGPREASGAAGTPGAAGTSAARSRDVPGASGTSWASWTSPTRVRDIRPPGLRKKEEGGQSPA